MLDLLLIKRKTEDPTKKTLTKASYYIRYS
jgi:hypothetical protein